MEPFYFVLSARDNDFQKFRKALQVQPVFSTHADAVTI
jgi:hypothetical protein